MSRSGHQGASVESDTLPPPLPGWKTQRRRPAVAEYLRRIAPHWEPDTCGHTGRTVEADHETAWIIEQYRKAGAAAVREAARHGREAVRQLEKALRTIEAVASR